MKQFWVFLLLLGLSTATSVRAQQQGTVTFANSAGTPIYHSGFGTNIHARVALYGSQFTNTLDDSLMSQVGATANTFAPGLFAGGTRNIGEPGNLVRLQVRAWTGGFATYELASAAAISGDSSVALNRSHVWLQPVGGGVQPTQPITGAGRFNGLDLAPIPEPTSVTLAVLMAGVFALMFRRRST